MGKVEFCVGFKLLMMKNLCRHIDLKIQEWDKAPTSFIDLWAYDTVYTYVRTYVHNYKILYNSCTYSYKYFLLDDTDSARKCNNGSTNSLTSTMPATRVTNGCVIDVHAELHLNDLYTPDSLNEYKKDSET